MKRLFSLTFLLCSSWPLLSAQATALVVVEDRGGVSALPYYQDLEPEPTANATPPQDIGVRSSGAFPVRSAQLTPGAVPGRVINAPGLQPVFLVGDDEHSRAWLVQRRDLLQQMQAVGLVVNVASARRLAEVRRWADGLQVVATPADDLAIRLGINHYPVLLTPTAIQQ
nr:integrating conjugative element protein [Pseudomonas benzenivorans]